MKGPLVEVRELTKHFAAGGKGRRLKAVDGVSFEISTGETLGMVGESGCGKSTLGRTLLGLYTPTTGEVRFDGEQIGTLSGRRGKALRRRMQMVFQDPYGSLNPRMTVQELIGEALAIHKLGGGRRDRKLKVEELLELVGMRPEQAGRYPHEFSGGQRQRIGIARALAVSPDFIVLDEPISALDVSVQAQVVNLLKRLQSELGLTYLFIAHDLAMVRYLSDRVAVMYLGKIVELTRSEELYRSPLHPYTKALLDAVPSIDPPLRIEPSLLQGDPPSPIDLPSGCRFRTRCPLATAHCAIEEPSLIEVTPGHWTACHMAEESPGG